MHIEICLRAYPEEWVGEGCGLCRVRFEPRVVYAVAVAEFNDAPLCPACLAYLERRNPERFSGITEALELANRVYPEPMFPSAEAQEAAVEKGLRADDYRDAGGVVREFRI